MAWFEGAARRRREAMADVMWDEAGGRWRDVLLPEAASDPAAAAREQGALFHHLVRRCWLTPCPPRVDPGLTPG